MPASPKRILLAPLDWGLGHTTRCVPLIRALQAMGHTPVLAGNDMQQAFLRRSFPGLEAHPLPGYEVRYARFGLMLGIVRQLPRLLRVIREEHHWLTGFAEKAHIDGIISDNRYGLWHTERPSVILTHQPAVISGLGRVADAALRRLHYRFLERFTEIWIPDLPVAEQSLGGKLSHPPSLPADARYIGWLSQFESDVSAENNGALLILLSGPEPQRSMLADKLWQQALALHRPVVFVEGKAGIQREPAPHVRHISLADAAMLQPLLRDAAIVVCRSGYSTLMDLAQFGKPAILIPTPGQTEQEFLAQSLSERGLFHAARQQYFSLEEMLAIADSHPRKPPLASASRQELMHAALSDWLLSF